MGKISEYDIDINGNPDKRKYGKGAPNLFMNL